MALRALFPVSHTSPPNPLNLPWLLSLESLGLLGPQGGEGDAAWGWVPPACWGSVLQVCPAGPRVSAAELVEGHTAPVSTHRRLRQQLSGRDMRFVLHEPVTLALFILKIL